MIGELGSETRFGIGMADRAAVGADPPRLRRGRRPGETVGTPGLPDELAGEGGELADVLDKVPTGRLVVPR